MKYDVEKPWSSQSSRIPLLDIPANILYKSTAGCYRPVSYPDGPITARCRFIKNAYWDRSLYARPVNKMPRFCTMTNEYDIFSFELHSITFNRHCHGNVLNQELGLSVTKTAKSDHPCIGRRRSFVRTSLKDYNSGLIIWETK